MFTTVLGSTAGKDSVLLGAAAGCSTGEAGSACDSGLALEAASLRTTMLLWEAAEQQDSW